MAGDDPDLPLPNKSMSTSAPYSPVQICAEIHYYYQESLVGHGWKLN